MIGIALFDLDDTLHDDTLAYRSAAEEVAREIAIEHEIDAIALKAAYVVEAEGFWTRLESSQLQTKLSSVRERMWQTALGRVGIDDEALARRSAERYNAYRKKYLSPFPGTIALLCGLRAGGKKLGLVTNGFSETHREKIALLRIGEYFDALFMADEVGMLKPDPLLFAHACKVLGGSPRETAMVGDRYDRDIRGALEAGLYAVWMNVRGEQVPKNAPPPSAICSTIEEVGPILETARRG